MDGRFSTEGGKMIILLLKYILRLSSYLHDVLISVQFIRHFFMELDANLEWGFYE